MDTFFLTRCLVCCCFALWLVIRFGLLDDNFHQRFSRDPLGLQLQAIGVSLVFLVWLLTPGTGQLLDFLAPHHVDRHFVIRQLLIESE